jgi:hypothetical protein
MTTDEMRKLFDGARHEHGRAELRKHLEDLAQHCAGKQAASADGTYSRDELVDALRTASAAFEEILAMTVSVATDRLVFDRFGLDVEEFLARPPASHREAIEDALLAAKSLNAGRWPEYANYPLDLWLREHARGGISDELVHTCFALHRPDVTAERPAEVRTVLDMFIAMHWGRRQPSASYDRPPHAANEAA